MEHHAVVAPFELLVFIAAAEHAEEHAVYADRCLDYVGGVAFVELGIEILYLLAGELFVLREVEVGAGVYALNLLESERHLELDVGGGVGIVGKLLVVVETVFLIAETESLVPFEASLAPCVEPFELLARTHEELHLHLFELAHAENELTCHNLVAECFSDLRYAKRNAHASCLLHVEIVYEYALGRLRTEIYLHCSVGSGTHLGLEHQVELAHVSPVACAGDWIDDLIVYYDLAQVGEIVGVHGRGEALMKFVAFFLVLKHAGIGLTEHCLVEAVAETFAGLCHLFVDLIIEFGNLLLDEHICAVAFLGVFVVDERIVEGVDVARGLPDGRVHEDGRVDAHDVVVEHGHGLPPIAFDIVFELDAVLSVVVDSRQSVVDLT